MLFSFPVGIPMLLTHLTLSFENSNLKMEHAENQRRGSCQVPQIYTVVFLKSMVLD